MIPEYDPHVLQILHDERFDRLARHVGRPRQIRLRSTIWQRIQGHGPSETEGH